MLQAEISKSEQEVRSEVRKTQDSTTNALTVQLEGVRTTFSTAQKDATDTLVKTIGELGKTQASKLEDVTKSTSDKINLQFPLFPMSHHRVYWQQGYNVYH